MLPPFAASAASLEQQSAAWDEALEGDQVIIDGLPYFCAVGVGRINHVPTDGGWQKIQSRDFSIRKELMIEPPAAGTKINYNGAIYDLTAVSGDSPGCLTWTLIGRRIV